MMILPWQRQESTCPLYPLVHRNCVEGKQGSIGSIRNLNDGVAQPWANMMVLSVERLLECCDQVLGRNL